MPRCATDGGKTTRNRAYGEWACDVPALRAEWAARAAAGRKQGAGWQLWVARMHKGGVLAVTDQ
jgi:hypothetical protein